MFRVGRNDWCELLRQKTQNYLLGRSRSNSPIVTHPNVVMYCSRGYHEFYMCCQSSGSPALPPPPPPSHSHGSGCNLSGSSVSVAALSDFVSCCVLGVAVHLHHGSFRHSLKSLAVSPLMLLCPSDSCTASVKSSPEG